MDNKKNVEDLNINPNIPKPIVKRGLSSIERMIDNSSLKCVKCGAKAGYCDCWSECPVDGCGWSVEKGYKCRNPNHE
jgi:hypothetical protein